MTPTPRADLTGQAALEQERQPRLAGDERYPQPTDRGVTRTDPPADPFTVDWLDYTAPDGVPLRYVLPGAEDLPWTELDHGVNGYRRGLAYGALRVYYDGQPGMGTHVHLSGRGCRELEASGLLGDDAGAGWVQLQRMILDNDYSVARVDYALDDRAGELDMDVIRAATSAGHFTSKWHRGKAEQEFDGAGDLPNRSITFGSPSSNSRLRIYDKRAEQAEKGNDAGAGPWVRAELQLRNKPAEAVMRQLVDAGGDVAPLLGVLHAHIDFKSPSATDSNKRRWGTAPWWLAFLRSAQKRRLGLGRKVRTLEDKLRWLERSVEPTLGLVDLAHGGRGRWLLQAIERGKRRLKPRDLALLAPAA